MHSLCFQISDWTLVVEENKLYRQGRSVAVEPRLVNLLSFLAQSPGAVFGREELIEHVWSGAIVTDQVVTQSIFELRKVLKDGRADCDRFIVTVPKRGYTLVAETRVLSPEEATRLKCEGLSSTTVIANQDDPVVMDADDETAVATENVDDIAIFPAAPLTRAVTNFSKHCEIEQRKHDKELTFFQRYKLHIFDVFLLLALIVVIVLCSYSKKVPDITKTMDISAIEFSYRDGRNSTSHDNALADGISRKLMADVLTLGKYQVKLKKIAFTTGILPGKSVIVSIGTQQGQSYLTVKYRNNTSGNIVFSRQYLVSDEHLHPSLRQASQDLMEVLAIAPSVPQLDFLMQDLPTNAEQLTKLILANHYLNQLDLVVFNQGIALLDQLALADPDNGLVLAEKYIAYSVLAALNPQLDLVDAQSLARQQLVQAYPQMLAEVNNNMSSRKLPVRVYEAFALLAMHTGETAQAKVHLAQAGLLRKSTLFYVIQGKFAELDGDLNLAGDSYTQAFYIDTSLETYKLCQNLDFYSNIETIAHFMYRAVNPLTIKLL